MENITFKQIGKVISDITDPKDMFSLCEKGINSGNISRIIISEEYEDFLIGLNDFSHIHVIYYLDKEKDVKNKSFSGPPNINNLNQVGTFATRSQYRPNKIGLRVVKLIKIDNNILEVMGLDAVNNSPVLDIKPYIPGFDKPENVKVSENYNWLNKS